MTGPASSRGHPSLTPAASCRFAHPSERIFAALLDAYGLAWEYEPVEFTLQWDADGRPVSGFRPDFWLPAVRSFVELTTADQRLVTRKNAKVRRLRELHPGLRIEVVYQRDYRAILRRHGLDVDGVSAA